MNTILQKRIKEEAKEEREQCREDNNEIWRGNPTYNDIEASFIKGAIFALQNQWISVEEALPEEHVDVFVMNEYGGHEYAYYDYENKTWRMSSGENAEGSDEIYSTITYWMEIPKNK